MSENEEESCKPHRDRNPFSSSPPGWLKSVPGSPDNPDERQALWCQAGDYFDAATHAQGEARRWRGYTKVANIMLTAFAALAAGTAGVTGLAGTKGWGLAIAIFAITGGVAAALAGAINPSRRAQALDSAWYAYDLVRREIRYFAEIELRDMTIQSARRRVRSFSTQLDAIGRDAAPAAPDPRIDGQLDAGSR